MGKRPLRGRPPVSSLHRADADVPLDVPLIERKRLAREWALAARQRASVDAGDGVAAALWTHLAPVLEGETARAAGGAAIAAYWPIGDEMDVRDALTRLDALGHRCVLPVVVARGAALAFRRWRPGDALLPGPLGTRMPDAAAPEVTPDVVLAPLLAFDRAGRRLGYGGGYYDRTLRALRRAVGVVAVGVGFAAQEMAEVPAGSGDERLDWIVTEREAIRAA